MVASDKKDIDNRLKLLAENSKKYNDKNKNEKAQNTDLVIFDYEATVDNKVFENNKGNDIQIILGKDLFIKDFDKQLIGSKVNQTINVSVNLPQNFPRPRSRLKVRDNEDSLLFKEFTVSWRSLPFCKVYFQQ